MQVKLTCRDKYFDSAPTVISQSFKLLFSKNAVFVINDLWSYQKRCQNSGRNKIRQIFLCGKKLGNNYPFMQLFECCCFFQAQNQTQARTKCLPSIDAYCRLIALLVKHSGDNSNSVTKINLLNRVS